LQRASSSRSRTSCPSGREDSGRAPIALRSTLPSTNSTPFAKIGMAGRWGAGIQLGSFDTTAGVAYTRTDGKILVYDQLSEAALGASQRGEVYWPSVSTTSDTVMLILSAAVTSEEAKRTIEEYAPIRMPALPQSTLPMGAPRGGGAPGIPPGVTPPRWQAPPSPTVPPTGQHRPGLAPAPGDAPPRSPVLDGAANPSGGPQ